MNGFRKKLLGWKQRLSDRHMYSIVITVVAIVAAVGIYQYKKAVDFRNEAQNQYNRAFFELVDAVNNVEVSLSKSMLVSTDRKMTDLASEVWRYATFAQADLGQLPIAHQELENASKFLTQVGAYTYSLSRKTMDGAPVTDDDYKQLEKLQNYAKGLNNNLIQMEQAVQAGTMRFGQLQKQGAKFFGEQEQSTAGENIAGIKKEFQDYPSLIYDGPFSDKVSSNAPRMLNGQKELSVEDAQKKAADFIGSDRAGKMEFTGEVESTVKEYQYNASPDKDRTISISVTKVGGFPVWMLDNRAVTESKLTIEQANQKAESFLQQRGFNNMKQSYFSQSAGVATLNYAYVQDGIVCYTDLLKVKVALDNGDVVGFEARQYLSAHLTKRSLPPIKITEAQAKTKINPRLKVDASRLAVIPTDTEKELLCYELQGRVGDRNFLIYVNVENGREERVLLLLETPDGILSM